MRRLDACSPTLPPRTRIELLLAAFDDIVSQLRQDHERLEPREQAAAERLLLRSQRIMQELKQIAALEQTMNRIRRRSLNRAGPAGCR